MPRITLHFKFNLLRAIALCLALLVAIAFSELAFAQEAHAKTITVTGEAIISLPTTITQVVMGVEVQGKTAQEVQQEVARRSSSLEKFLRSRQVDNLETTSINLRPNYTLERDRTQLLVGYTGINIVSFRLNTLEVGKVFDEAIKAGASRIDGISFVAEANAIAQARDRALRAATQEAQRQADVVLDSLNLKRRDVMIIKVDKVSSPAPRLYFDRSYSEGNTNSSFSFPPTSVLGSPQQVEADVTLEISY